MGKYTAVLIARNEEKYIEQTIVSILNQSVPPYRIIVVNDGSTDATPAILKRLAVDVITMSHNDTPKILTGKLTALRNAAYQEVKDDPVHWLYSGDADMALSRRYCETVMQRASQCDAVLACGSYVTNCHNLSQFDQLWSNTGCDFPELHYDNLPMSGCSMIYMDWFKSFGMKNELESIYLVLRAWLSGKNTLVCRMPECAVLALRSPNANYSVVEHYNGGR